MSEAGSSLGFASGGIFPGFAEERVRWLLVRWVDECAESNLNYEGSVKLLFEKTDCWAGDESVRTTIVRTSRLRMRQDELYPITLCPLHLSARMGIESCVEILLQFGWYVDEQCYTSNSTPLHVACGSNHPRVAKLLIEHEADVDATNRWFRTPLMVAIACEARACVDLLLDGHANIVTLRECFYSVKADSALVCAAEKNDVRTISKMIANYSIDELFFGRNDPLVSASAYGSSESLEVLLVYVQYRGKSELVNATSEYSGKTPLMSVGRNYRLSDICQAKYEECMNLLLSHGADANVLCNNLRYPALYYAISDGHSDGYCVTLLRHTDLNSMAEKIRDEVVFETAARGRLELMAALHHRYGALVSAKRFRLIARAFFSNSLTEEMIAFLLDVGVDVARVETERERNVESYIYEAFCRHNESYWTDCRLRVMEMLLNAGAGDNAYAFLELQRKLTTNYSDFADAVLDLVWKYATQKQCNFLASTGLVFSGNRSRSAYRLPSLKHSCRLAVRSALLSTGRFPSMCKVSTKHLGLPETLQNYVMFWNCD